MKACGKVILCGEHAVVYGRPGIAVPVKRVYTIILIAKDGSFSYETDRDLDDDEKKKIDTLFAMIFDRLAIKDRNLSISIESNIPPASGMGSSASLSVALIRALLSFNNLSLDNSRINELAYECEKLFHGNPSGIDNTVITYEKPVFYQNKRIEDINIMQPLKLVIANTGMRSNTSEAVSLVMDSREKNPERYDKYFTEIESIVISSRECLEKGDMKQLGRLMTKNHEILREMGISSDALDSLVNASVKAGAFGAKLAGAGLGGNAIALVDDRTKEKVIAALKPLAKEVLYTVIS